MKSIEFKVGGAPQPKGSYFGWIRGFPQKRWTQGAIATAIKKLVAMIYRVEHPIIDIMPTNKKLKPWEKKVSQAATISMVAEHGRFTGPCRVYLVFYLKRPTTHYGSQHGKPYLKERFKKLFCTKAPDTDKLVRAVFDGMNKVVYDDDSQVVDLCARKLWGKHAGVWVKVEEIEDLTPADIPELDQMVFNFE